MSDVLHWFRRKQCPYCLFPFMSAQLWQRLSILHHRNVPGSTFHRHISQIFKQPKTRYRWLNSIVLYVSVCTVSLMVSSTPAHYLAKLVQLCTSYVLPRFQNRVSISTASDSKYSLITVMELLMSASACLRFGGLKSFLSFPVAMLFLYYLSDHISLPFTVRVITVLCVWFFSTRSVTLLKLLILLLVLAGQELVLTECPYLSDSSVWNTRSCQHHATISIYTE